MNQARNNSAFRANSLPWWRFFEFMCGLGSFGAAIFALILVKHFAIDVPFWDEWDWTPLIVSRHEGTLTFEQLWRQHNEHRMLFPSLITIGLDTLGGWSQVRECMTSVAVAILGQLLVFKILRETFTREVALPIFLIESFLIFSPSQSENLTWGFQLAWFLINTAALGAVWFLTRPILSVGSLAAAASCAIVAAYSCAFGLCVLPAGLIVLLLRRDGLRAAFGWTVMSVAVITIYLAHFHTAASTPTADGASLSALSLAHYVLSYLGLPLGRWMGLTGSTTQGGLVLCFFAASVAVILRNPLRDTATFDRSLPWLAIAAYALATAALTAIGRVHFGVDQSLASRYETTALMFWVATVPLCADALLRLGATRWATLPRALILVVAVVEACAYVRNATFGIREMHAYRAVRVAGRAALAARYSASNISLATLYPNTELIRYYMHGLQRVADGPLIGNMQPSAEVQPPYLAPALGPGRGFIDGIVLEEGGKRQAFTEGQSVRRTVTLSLNGWTVDPAARMPAAAVVAIVDGRPMSRDVHVVYGLPRPDVVAVIESDMALHTGYLVDVDLEALKPGSHVLVLGSMRWDRLGYYSIGNQVDFSVSPTHLVKS